MPPQLINKWRLYNNINQVRIGVLHFADIEMDTGDKQQKDSPMNISMDLDKRDGKWYKKVDFVISDLEFYL